MDKERLQSIFFMGLLVGMLILIFFIFRPYLTIFIISGTLAVIFAPFYKKVLKAVKKTWIAAIISVLAALIILFIPLTFFSTLVIQQAGQLYISVRSGASIAFLNNITTYLQAQLQLIDQNISLNISELLQQALSWMLGSIGAIFSKVTNLFFGFLLSLLAFYYFLKDGKNLTRNLIALSPLKDTDDEEIIQKLNNAIHSVILGSLVVALIQGTLVSIGFYLFGVPNAALWGAVGAIAALIPFVGTALVVIPAVIYLLISSSLFYALGLLLWGTVAVGLIDNLLIPKLIERGVRIHPLLILFSVLGGLSLFGPAGFLIGPLVLSLLFALLDIYKKQLVTNNL